MTDRIARLENMMSEIAGAAVELTVRGDKSFTFSTETVCRQLGENIAAYFGPLASVTEDHDEECGSFVYVDVT